MRVADQPDALPVEPDLAAIDVSFISLTLALPPVLAVCESGATLLAMVKPQFEVGRTRLGARGVVASPDLRAEAVLGVARVAHQHGGRVRAVVPSPVAGEHGNLEYFLRVDVDGAVGTDEVPSGLVTAVRTAVVDGTAALVEEHA